MNRRLMMRSAAIAVVIASVAVIAYQRATVVNLDVPSASDAADPSSGPARGKFGRRLFRTDTSRALHQAASDAARQAARQAERDVRDVEIRVWNEALAADPVSAVAMGQLAALHLQRAREQGHWDDYLQAESLARRSLSMRTRRNAATAVTLTNALLAQHRFPEALDVARTLVSWEPEQPAYLALLGEVSMEIGDDSTAAALFTTVWTARSTLSVAPRLARWFELTNRVEMARRVLHAARAEALTRRDLSAETKVWFHLRVGDLELRAGRARDAADAFRAGLALNDEDPRLLVAMARLAEQQNEPKAVLAWGERAMAVRLEPATLGLMANAYAQIGDSAKASEYGQTLALIAATQEGPYDRALGLYLLEQPDQVSAVLARAQAELTTRRDVYGYDLVAWALYRSGRITEARAMMDSAMRLQTPDPMLRRHAEHIAAASNPVSASR